jgi:hypothetical protein
MVPDLEDEADSRIVASPAQYVLNARYNRISSGVDAVVSKAE